MSTLRAIMGLCCTLCSVGAMCAEIYRCQANGVTTFVDSPNRCPNGTAQRQHGFESKPGGAAPARPIATSGTDPIKSVRPVAAARPARAHAATACQALVHDAARFRQCLREERRAEVRRIASPRLEAIGRAVADHVSFAARTNSVLAVSNTGRSPEWCEDILKDVMALKDLEVVDDEEVGGPRWMQTGNGTVRSSAEVLDAEFREWALPDVKVPHGYVTVRWRSSSLVVLRVVAACTSTGDGRASCNPQRHTSIYVYDDVTPVACNVSAFGRPYWPNWKNSQTPIFAKSVSGAVR